MDQTIDVVFDQIVHHLVVDHFGPTGLLILKQPGEVLLVAFEMLVQDLEFLVVLLHEIIAESHGTLEIKQHSACDFSFQIKVG